MVGDRVRISKYTRTLFDKDYTPNWSEDILVILRVKHTNPPPNLPSINKIMFALLSKSSVISVFFSSASQLSPGYV